MSDVGIAVGIDLGTTYSVVSIFHDNEIKILLDEDGDNTIPSFVAFTEEEELVGKEAKNQTATNATNTVFDAKRLIGRMFADPIV